MKKITNPDIDPYNEENWGYEGDYIIDSNDMLNRIREDRPNLTIHNVISYEGILDMVSEFLGTKTHIPLRLYYPLSEQNFGFILGTKL